MQRQVKRPRTRILNLQFHLRARVVYVGTSRWAGEAWHVLHCPDDTAIVELVESRRTEAKERLTLGALDNAESIAIAVPLARMR